MRTTGQRMYDFNVRNQIKTNFTQRASPYCVTEKITSTEVSKFIRDRYYPDYTTIFKNRVTFVSKTSTKIGAINVQGCEHSV